METFAFILLFIVVLVVLTGWVIFIMVWRLIYAVLKWIFGVQPLPKK